MRKNRPGKAANGVTPNRGTSPSPQPSPRGRGSKAITAQAGQQALARPFATGIIKQAALVAEQYQVILEHSEGRWYGRGLEMPQVFGDGATPGQCVEATRAALNAAVA
jgi:hypothetical protein